MMKNTILIAVLIIGNTNAASAQDVGCVLGRTDYDERFARNVTLETLYANLPCAGREYLVQAGDVPEGGNWSMVSDVVRRGAEWFYQDENGIGTIRARIGENGLVEGYGVSTKPIDSADNPIVGLSGLFPHDF